MSLLSGIEVVVVVVVVVVTVMVVLPFLLVVIQNAGGEDARSSASNCQHGHSGVGMPKSCCGNCPVT